MARRGAVTTVPPGYLWTVAIMGVATLLVRRPLRRPRPLATLSFLFGAVVGELPFIALYWLVASTLLALAQGDLGSPGGWAALGLAVLTTVGLARIVQDASRTGLAIERALRAELGTGLERRLSRSALARILFAPFPLWRRDVERIANIRYGAPDKPHRLDLYRHRSRPSGRPVLIHFHGGHFQMGGKSREARALFHRLARHGWVCVSADYRLRGAGRFPNSLIDAKQVVAWVRGEAAAYGADPSTVFVAGSSAGAHLASMAALTPNDPRFQPGFEGADTSVAAAICLYGYYGSRDATASPPSSPRDYVGPDAPPFWLAHGDRDTMAPVGAAAQFAEELSAVSESPVVYAELPGAQHAFDLFHSLRFERVIDGIEAFAARVSSRAARSERLVGGSSPH